MGGPLFIVGFSKGIWALQSIDRNGPLGFIGLYGIVRILSRRIDSNSTKMG